MPLQNEFRYTSVQPFVAGETLSFRGFFTVATVPFFESHLFLSLSARPEQDSFNVAGHGANSVGSFITHGMIRGHVILLCRKYTN